MLEAMIKKKGEAPPGALARLNSCRVGGRLNTALKGYPQGQCVQAFLLPRRPCVARQANLWPGRWVWNAVVPTGRVVAYGALSQGMSALSCAFLLEIHSWFRRGLWVQRAVPQLPPLEKMREHWTGSQEAWA